MLGFKTEERKKLFYVFKYCYCKIFGLRNKKNVVVKLNEINSSERVCVLNPIYILQLLDKYILCIRTLGLANL
jgi:hypothetical protein